MFFMKYAGEIIPMITVSYGKSRIIISHCNVYISFHETFQPVQAAIYVNT